MIAWTVVLLAGSGIRPTRLDFYPYLAFGDGERLLCWLGMPTAWLLLIDHRPVQTALYPVSRRSVGGATAAAILLVIVLVLGMKVTRARWHAIPDGYSTLQYVAAAISIGLLALGEEFVFRGVFLSGLIQIGWRFRIANLVVATTFALSHWPGWLMFGGISAMSLTTATLRVMLFGWVMGGLVRLEGGLIAAVMVHWSNDLLAGALFQ